MNRLKLFANHYRSLGLNVTSISNELTEANFYSTQLLKAPNHKWKHYFTEQQTEEEFNSLKWENATGVGCVSGYRELLVIDIDGCTDYSILSGILNFCGLPADYEWVTQTGSKHGFHIIVRCPNIDTDSAHAVATYPPQHQFRHLFDKIELLWKTHVILPPSLHKSGNKYDFLNCTFPTNEPQFLDYKTISFLIEVYLEEAGVVWGVSYGESVIIDMESDSDNNGPVEKDEVNKFTFCILDTETDGLPVKLETGVKFPNVVQISWVVMDTKGRLLKKDSELINYPDIVHTEAFSINKIDIDIVKQIGKSPADAFKRFIADVKTVDCLVSHNTDFDLPTLKSEFNKYNLQDVITGKKSICTMKSSVDFCKIQQKDGRFSYPRLPELFKHLFNYEVNQNHNAITDVMILTKCFKEMLDRGLISYPT